jgi:hypothetical protein
MPKGARFSFLLQDVRSSRAANRALANGGGTEPEEWYPGAEIKHLGLESRVGVRDAYLKLRESMIQHPITTGGLSIQ